MARSQKSNKEKQDSPKEKVSAKSKSKKGKDETTVDDEDLTSIVLEDHQWQSVVVVVVLQNQKLYDDLLLQINSLPTNFTVLTPTILLKTSEKETSGGRSRGSSKVRKQSASKSSKKTTKTKTTGAKKAGKIEEVKDENVNQKDSDCTKTLLLLKKYILGLRNADIKKESSAVNEQSDSFNKKVRNDFVQKNEEQQRVEDETNIPIQRFIILWGFYYPKLLQECSKFNISIKVIIQIKQKLTHFTSSERTPDVEKKFKGKVREIPIVHRATEEYSIFIEELNKDMKDAIFLEENKDVLFLNYTVAIIDDLGEQKSFELNFLKIIYGICEAWKKFSKYNECLRLQDVPEIQETLTLDDANLYTTMISIIPLESVSVPIILHSMLEQICWWDEHILSRIDEYPPDESKDHDTTVCSVPSISTSSVDIKPSLSSQDDIKNKTPILIDERDDIRRNTFHLNLSEIDFQKITTDLLTSSPVYRLWMNYSPHTTPTQKWYDYHIQKFKKCAENCYFDLHTLFILYLHQSVMNILISNPYSLSIGSGKEKSISQNEESDTYFFSTSKETISNDSLVSFVRGMMCNILCKIPKICEDTSSPSESSIQLGESATTTEDVHSNISVQSKWYEIEALQLPLVGGFIGEKQNYKQNKLNKLRSFLLCSEFINLYIKKFETHEQTDYMKSYEFFEILNVTPMCQSLQKANENFINSNYYYFSPCDTILLWFNNTVEKDVTLSRRVQGVLETALGFRDFYKYKLGGKTNLEDTLPEGESLVDTISDLSDIGSSGGKYSSSQNTDADHNSHTKVDETFPNIAYKLGSSRIEVTEYNEYFFSPDSSSVTVKETKCFANKRNIAVTINKNNTFLDYNFSLDTPQSFIQLKIKLYNDIMVHSQLHWRPHTMPLPDIILNDDMTGSDCENIADEFLINCHLTITVPSGLLIEIIPTESSIGPFYIRQSYLLKGPLCGSIWEESHRCYLKNGTILVFNSDSTIYILYSNGTMVKCNTFELEKNDLESVHIKNNYTSKENVLNDDQIKKQKEELHDKGKKGTKGKDKNKTKKNDNGLESVYRNTKNKGHQESLEPAVKEGLEIHEEKSESETYVYKIIDYSVISWDGNCREFDRDCCRKKIKIHDFRMAFDKINQELYLQRSDGMTSLFTPDKLTVLFPDDSKITSYTDDSRELNGEYLTVVDEITHKYETTSVTSEALTEANKTDTRLSEEVQSQSDINQENFIYVETSYLMEHNNYATVQYKNGDREIVITLPGNIEIYIYETGIFTIESKGNEKITLNNSNLIFEAQVTDHPMQRARTTLYFKNVSQNPTVSCQTVDTLCNVFSISEKGHTSFQKGGLEVGTPIFYSPLHPENVERLFVLNRDLTGYEMIHNVRQYKYATVNNDSEKRIIKTPIVKNNTDIFSVYSQTPMYKTKSEQYLVNNVKYRILPTLIKRTDLFKLKEMPESIWFYPHLSIVTQTESRESVKMVQTKRKEILKAISILKYSRIIKNIDLSNWFSKAIYKYMKISENTFNKYLDHYPVETINEETYAEGEQHKQKVLGSLSYYLTDNLPKVVCDNLSDYESKISIQSAPTSNSSKATSLYNILKEIQQQ